MAHDGLEHASGVTDRAHWIPQFGKTSESIGRARDGVFGAEKLQDGRPRVLREGEANADCGSEGDGCAGLEPCSRQSYSYRPTFGCARGHDTCGMGGAPIRVEGGVRPDSAWRGGLERPSVPGRQWDGARDWAVLAGDDGLWGGQTRGRGSAASESPNYYTIRYVSQQLVSLLCKEGWDAESRWCFLHCLIHRMIARYAGLPASLGFSIGWEALEFVCFPVQLPLYEHTTDLLWCDRIGEAAASLDLFDALVMCAIASGAIARPFDDLGLAPYTGLFESAGDRVRSWVRAQVPATAQVTRAMAAVLVRIDQWTRGR